ncbi:hypothetical protein TNCV_3597491 [Trichonephila clavipes]|nr:hypothetical protein TNCV_3597491 [Trichonephila clavipes]
MAQQSPAEALDNAEHLPFPLSIHFTGHCVSNKKGSMINEPVKTTPCCPGECKRLLCVLTWIRGRPNGTVMVVNVTMKRNELHLSQNVKASWRIRRRILRTDDGKPNRLAASRALLVPEAYFGHKSLPFRQQCECVLLSSMVVQLVLDPSTFQFPQNV